MKIRKKILAYLSLFAYISLLMVVFSPITNAYTMCTGKLGEYTQSFNSEDEYKAHKDSNEYDDLEEAIGAQFQANKASESKQCGTENEITGFLEKGDCTAEGYVITEISESFAAATETENDEIIDVYKGSCCLYDTTTTKTDDQGSPISECKDTRYIYTTSFQTCKDAADACEKRQWIIANSGAGILKVYVKQLYRWAAGTVGFIAVVTIVISGIQISVSGVSGDITSAKNRILQSIAGLVLLFLSGIILYTINPDFFS